MLSKAVLSKATLSKALIPVLAVTLLIISPDCRAQDQPPGPLGKWWQTARVAEELKLTQEEQRALDDHFLELSRTRIALRSQIQEARLLIDSYFDREGLDQEAISDQFQKISQAQAGLAMAQSQFLLEVRKLLGRARWQRLRVLFQELKTDNPQRRPRKRPAF